MSVDESVLADGLMSVAEAMRFLAVSRSHLYELMHRRLLPWAKIGRSRRLPRRAVVAFLAGNLHGVDPPGTLDRR